MNIAPPSSQLSPRTDVPQLLTRITEILLAAPPPEIDPRYLQSFLQRRRPFLLERLQAALVPNAIIDADEPDEEPLEVDDPTCPHCGELYDFDGLDVRISPDGERWVDWLPCCLPMQEEVAALGWDEVFGRSLESALRRWSIAPDVRRVDQDDSLVLAPLTGFAPGAGKASWQSDVFREIARHHLHHDPPPGWKFGVAVYNGPARVGVAVVGRPVSRKLQEAEPNTLEVTRICTWGDARLRRNAVTKLLGLCRREARRLGASRLITYTLEEETGSSLKAAGFTAVAHTKGGNWDRPGRRRNTTAPTTRKVRWETEL